MPTTQLCSNRNWLRSLGPELLLYRMMGWWLKNALGMERKKVGIYWEGKDEGVMEKFGGTNTHNEKGTKAICAEYRQQKQTHRPRKQVLTTVIW